MPISDDQFTAWLRTDAERVLLVHLKYGIEEGTPLGPTEATLHFSAGRYASHDTDTPANQRYHDRVVGSAGFARSIDLKSLGGQAQIDSDTLELLNTDGRLDYLTDLVVDGYPIECYYGAPSWALSDFRLVLVAVTESITGDEGKIKVKTRDKRLLLDRDIKGNALGQYAGSPGTEGPNPDKFLPLLWGYVQNIDLTEYLYDTATLEYGVVSNYDTNTRGIAGVRDDGISLRAAPVTWTSGNTSISAVTGIVTHVGHNLRLHDVIWGTDHTDWPYGSLSYALRLFNWSGGTPLQLWVNSVIDDDHFTLSSSRGGSTLIPSIAGWNPDGVASGPLYVTAQRFCDTVRTNGRMQLSSKAVGRLTCDVYSVPTTGGLVGGPEFPFTMAAALMRGYGGLTADDFPDPFGTDPFRPLAADSALDAKVTLPFATVWIPERKNLIQVLNDWFSMFFGWYGQDNLGIMKMGVLDISGLSSATPTRTLTAKEVNQGISVENLPISLGAAVVNYALNRTVQTDGLSRLLTESERMQYSSEFGATQKSTAPSGTLYSGNKPAYHRTMTDAPPMMASLDTHIPGEPPDKTIGAYADEIVADHRPNLKVVTLQTRIDKYDWSLGEVVEFTYPRYGFDSGVNCYIVSVSPDFITQKVDFKLLTYVAPDVSSSTHD